MIHNGVNSAAYIYLPVLAFQATEDGPGKMETVGVCEAVSKRDSQRLGDS